MIDLKPQLDNSSVRELLSFCVGSSTPNKLETICEQYRSDKTRYLLGIEKNGQVIACLGIQIEQEHQAVIRCIAVMPTHRHQRIGEMLIKQASALFRLKSMTAETDIEAVGFYKYCGFEIISLGEVYPGTERFWCVLHL